jgi:hypothetical protein
MFANSQMSGLDTGFPDVCNTPSASGVTPISYPNTASGSGAVGSVSHVMFMSTPAHNMGTTVTQTNGDEAGVATGVASGTVMSTSRHLSAAFSVIIAGMPATRQTSVSLQNSTNCPGSRVSPSQTKVLILAG